LSTIHIFPFGDVDEGVLKHLCVELPKRFSNMDVVVEKPLPIPVHAYVKQRGQYLSTEFLALLPHKPGLVLGVTEVDLFVPGLNFVFGEAFLGGKVGVISLRRLRPEFYGEQPNTQLFHLRALKEAVHELGHAIGLHHCPDPKCVMHFSNSIVDTDHKEPDFCEKCSALAADLIRRLMD